MKNKNHVKSRYIAQAVVWLILLIVAIVALPNINQLVREKGQITVPKSATSQVADVIQNHWGRHEDNTRQVVVVFNNGEQPLTTKQQAKIDQTISSLQKHSKRYHIKSMTAPNENKYTKKQLISHDKTTQILELNVDKDQAVGEMTQTITQAAKTPGVKTYVTGADILDDDFINETQKGIKKTEFITIVFIFIVLMIVFHSVITPIISLLSVGVSMLISLSVVMNLASHFNFPLSNFTQVFMVVVLFGIGTDYNILLFDRFKGELSDGLSPIEATHSALKSAGKTILFSGSSVLIGFSTLGLARFSLYRSAVGVAVAVAILLLALLTLNPFFMAILGKYVFWPSKKFDGDAKNKMWHGISKAMVKRPFIGLGIAVLCAIPLLLAGKNALNYNTLVELHDNIPAKEGFKVVQKHFSKGTAEPTTIYIKSDHPLNNEAALKDIDQVANKIKAVSGVKTVATVTQPGGKKIKELYVNDQLKTVTQGTKEARQGLSQISNGLNQARQKLQNANLAAGIAGVNELYHGSQELQNGAQRLANGSSQFQHGLIKYANGVYSVQQGLNQLAEGTEPLQAGVKQLTNGATLLNNGLMTLNTKTTALVNGVGQLTTGSQQLAQGTTEFYDKLNAVAHNPQVVIMNNLFNDLKTGAADLAQGLQMMQSKLTPAQIQTLDQQISELVKALNQLQAVATPDISKLQQMTTDLAQNNTKVQQDATKLKNSLTQLQNTTTGILNNQQPVLSDAEITQIIQQINQKSGQTLTPQQAQAVTATLKQVSQQIGQKQKTALQGLISGIKTVNPQTTTLQNDLQTLNGTGNDLQQQLQQLKVVTDQLTKLKVLSSKFKTVQALTELNAALQEFHLLIQKLAPGADQIVNGLNQFSQTIGKVQQLMQATLNGSQQINQGAVQLKNGLAELNAQMPVMKNGIAKLSHGSTELKNGLVTMQGKIPVLVNAITALNQGTNELAANNPKLLAGASQMATGAQLLAQNQGRLTNGLGQMATKIKSLVGQMAALESGLAAASDGAQRINNGMGQANDYLTGLMNSAAADTYYVPQNILNGAEYGQALSAFLSEDNHAVKLVVILDENPESLKAMHSVEKIQSLVKKSIKGTSLAGATVATGGQTSYINDIRQLASKDFIRTAAIMLIGISLALMFITRSILQPVYILGTLILAYIMALDLTAIISKIVLHQDMLTWNTPFFGFIMLISLGVDYSIFLMNKYQNTATLVPDPKERIIQAAAEIGAVVVSAAFILSGTFAALMPSGVLTLIQVATVVIVGLMLLIFLIPTMIPSLMSLTYAVKQKQSKKKSE
ncbi:MMPL family transporter [Ligilactobacillus ceti]|uniref:MMPL family transporter n=1 Tax=Ligilactobacillus ceti TaxID=395085 RepID=UPI00041C01C5|nr:MMPL family transporter [Ligilactobacillus ceti]